MVVLTAFSIMGCGDTPESQTYTITFELGEVEGNTKAILPKDSITVKYGENYTLVTPSCADYEFLNWVIKGTDTVFTDSGIYPYKKDVVLVAKWESFWSGRG